jgi:arylsulfatase A-like enzyme
MLQEFFAYLDATVGKDNYIAVLTADHGFMPAPEVSRARGLDAGRISLGETLTRLNAELEKRFATPKLALYSSASTLVLDKKLIAEKGLSFDAVAGAARDFFLAEPGFAAAYTRTEITSRSRAGAPFFDAVLKAWNADLSGDVQVVLKPNWMFASSTASTTHGSPYPYDTNVPILFYGPAWTRAGRLDQRVEVVDIAPTLSALLGVAVPAASEGKPLPLGAR